MAPGSAIPPQLTVGLLWHSINSDNLGIGALTQSHIAILEDAAARLGITLRFRVYGWRDPRTPYVVQDNLEAFPLTTRSMVSPRGLFASLRGCDLVCDIGAGDSFADIYGRRRFAFNVWPKFVTLLARRPLVLPPQTVGPFRGKWSARIAAALVRRCRIVALRDDLSAEALLRMGVRVPSIAACDVAFRLPYRATERRPGPPRTGLNVSGLLFHGGYDRNNMFGLKTDYPAAMRRVIRGLQDAGSEVHLISHVVPQSKELAVEDDYAVAVQLAAEFPGLVVAPRFADPQEAKTIIATMDFMSGARMHACIAAFSAGVPTVPTAYSRKFRGVFDPLRYPHVADLQADDTDTVVAKVMDGFARREELAAAVREANTLALARLARYEDALRSCLSEVWTTKAAPAGVRTASQLAAGR